MQNKIEYLINERAVMKTFKNLLSINTNRNISKSIGQLSREDLLSELKSEKGLMIYPSPLKKPTIYKNIKSASLDITPSLIAMSAKNGLLETVYLEKTQYANRFYIYVKPKDTVLIVSNEYIILPYNIAGYVTSRVTNVVRGFGHISTTVDPGWKGAVLIALSNPSNHAIKIEVGTPSYVVDKSSEKSIEISTTNPLATLTFHYLCSPCKNIETMYKSMRTDLLDRISSAPRRKLLWRLRSVFNLRRRRFTDYFFEYIKTHEDDIDTPEGWERFLNEFSVLPGFNPITAKTWKRTSSRVKTSEFIVKETLLRRILRYLSEHKQGITKVLIIIAVIAFIVLCQNEIIPSDFTDRILDFLSNLL